jgi:predicted AlkP superfamily pyrophosphatase or phosphodiesterase
VSIDGLRADVVTSRNMPALVELRNEGASTLNARTDYHVTKTLPNHTSQFTGRPLYGTIRHRVSFNSDNGETVHDAAGSYVSSVFDVVDNNNGDTAMFVGKDKFQFIRRSWQDSIDDYEKAPPGDLVDDALSQLRSGDGPGFTFFHIRLPDSAGHAYGWSSVEYLTAVSEANAILQELTDGIRSDGALNGSTAIIVTADHGGPEFGLVHEDYLNVDNYVVPFIVWGPGVQPGADLYQLNASLRANPGNSRVDNDGIQPIRTHEVANLALDLLGLPPVPGSVFNADQSLRVG